jgi:hypothetical protein
MQESQNLPKEMVIGERMKEMTSLTNFGNLCQDLKPL